MHQDTTTTHMGGSQQESSAHLAGHLVQGEGLQDNQDIEAVLSVEA